MSNATNLAAVFDEHLRDESELHDAPATMTTMSESPDARPPAYDGRRQRQGRGEDV